MVEERFDEAIWIAHTLFARGSVTGSAGNISFLEAGNIYISGSGTCFGTLEKEQFSCLSLEGQLLNERKPSKEFPLHQMLYRTKPDIRGVIHTHSLYAVLYSFLEPEDPADIVPPYTPYLGMKVGTIGLVPYAKPGSETLFSLMRERLEKSDAYLLKQHGPVVGGKTLMDAFYGIEELEESLKIAWYLKKAGI
ncbi:MAG: class II aldolase/adducin family protein [Blautia sp.]|jgi:ribulose-5-phosphate 4-epimerase/fuculose-1-phosphate aldolase